MDIRELNIRIEQESGFIQNLVMGMDKVIVGQKHLVDSLLISLLSDGHILLEGVPGLAKTLAINTLSKLVDADFSRIQFTPDLLPADVTGTMIYSQKDEKFQVKRGPVFANFVLADEINRAPAKVQSALLEAMQEHQVTIGDNTFALPDPFLVMATQNPIEQEGTYPLPEAQMDRFFMRISMGYPTAEEEMLILERTENDNPVKRITKAVMNMNDILEIREEAKKIYVSEKIRKYIIGIVNNTRNNDAISLGISPRGSISLFKAAKAEAYINDRDYVIPDDVKYCAESVLAHRIILSPKGRNKYGTAEKAISAVLRAVEVPVE